MLLLNRNADGKTRQNRKETIGIRTVMILKRLICLIKGHCWKWNGGNVWCPRCGQHQSSEWRWSFSAKPKSSGKSVGESEPDFYCTSCDWEGFDTDVLCGSCGTVSKDINCDGICPACEGDELWDACPDCGSRATTLKELAEKQRSIKGESE